MLMISSRLNDKIMQLGAFEWVILVKNVFFRHFPIVFYRKYSKIKRIVFRTCCPWFQGLIFCTEPCLDTLEAWWKGQNGPLSFSLNSFSANDSRVCASDRGVTWTVRTTIFTLQDLTDRNYDYAALKSVYTYGQHIQKERKSETCKQKHDMR